MKLIYKVLLFSAILLSSITFAQEIHTEAKVNGACGMCKDRIEKISKTAGASKAEWDAETLTLKLEFDQSKTSLDQILKKIAEVGHDNEKYKTTQEVYDKLPGCCHYDRTVTFDKKEEKAIPQNIHKEAKVNGACEQCKDRIEKASKEAGASMADWDADTKILKLEFDNTKTSLDQILKKIAEVGHDNEKYKTTQEVYDKLPGCCHYDRTVTFDKKEEKSASEEMKMDMNSIKKEEHNHSEMIDKAIQEVKLTKVQDATALSGKSVDLTFNIGKKELLKAACCNLSESFETNATVDVSFSNAVTGTKQLKMLGLDQKYTALTKELLPEIRG
ncbi:MAG: heavy-metal-associated domain-containing protein, partial [Cloacibacterium sp.]|nr:heavy-metal-associated domain-containing protein [Cloacibacterium sp.]